MSAPRLLAPDVTAAIIACTERSTLSPVDERKQAVAHSVRECLHDPWGLAIPRAFILDLSELDGPRYEMRAFVAGLPKSITELLFYFIGETKGTEPDDFDDPDYPDPTVFLGRDVDGENASDVAGLLLGERRWRKVVLLDCDLAPAIAQKLIEDGTGVSDEEAREIETKRSTRFNKFFEKGLHPAEDKGLLRIAGGTALAWIKWKLTPSSAGGPMIVLAPSTVPANPGPIGRALLQILRTGVSGGPPLLSLQDLKTVATRVARTEGAAAEAAAPLFDIIVEASPGALPLAAVPAFPNAALRPQQRRAPVDGRGVKGARTTRGALLPAGTVVVLLGAHEWPGTELPPSESFKQSAGDIKAYLTGPGGLSIADDKLLDLFDCPDSAGDQIVRIGDFITSAATRADAQGRPLTDVLVYYIGHGNSDPEFHLLVRATRSAYERATALWPRALSDALRRVAPRMRHFIVLDCCFAGAAQSAFMSALEQAVAAEAAIALDVPRSGTVLLCSSSKERVSYAPTGAKHTLFTGAVLEVLARGMRGWPSILSFRDLSDGVWVAIKGSSGPDAPRPQLYGPDQEFGALDQLPAFPNAGFQ